MNNSAQESILMFETFTKGLKEFAANGIFQLTGGEKQKLACRQELGSRFGH
jgi:hypothetical protein